MFPRVTVQVAEQIGASPISQTVVNSFEGGVFQRIVTTTKIIVYRAEGGLAGNYGGWYGLEKPISALDAEEMSNLAKYGNTAQRVVTYEIPAGTTIYEGRVAGGAGQQIYVANPQKAGLQIIESDPLPVSHHTPGPPGGSFLQ